MKKIFLLIGAAFAVQNAFAQNSQANPLEGEKTAVVFFSATGTTKTVALKIAAFTDAEIFEIEALVPYTSADLNWRDKRSRSSIETEDADSRPQFKEMQLDFSGYDAVFIGYPIWWGEAPHIVWNFTEQAKFGGATIYPFCTSGGSGVGMSAKNLEKLDASNALWKSGARLNANSSVADLANWIKR